MKNVIQFIIGLTLGMPLLSLTVRAEESAITIAVFSITQHTDDKLRNTPRHIPGNNGTTYHPQFSLQYTKKYMQYSAFYINDTYANHAGGVMLGPKYNLYKHYVSIGAVAGLYVREDQPYNKFPMTKTINGVQYLPLGFVNAAVNIPVGKSLDLSINTSANPVLINQSYGLRWRF